MLTSEILREIAARRVVVIGDARLDRFTETGGQRAWPGVLSPAGRREGLRSCPGGAANAAANAAGLGASVELISVVGDDEAGHELTTVLADRGVGLAGMVTVPGWSTPVVDRGRGDGEAAGRPDQRTEAPPGSGAASRLVDLLHDLGPAADAVIVSDDGRGAVSDAVVGAIARLASAPLVPLLAVDAHHLARYRPVRPTLVKPSWEETVALLGPVVIGQPDRRADAVVLHARAILGLTGADIAAVTLDRDGAVVLERGRPPHHTSARPADDDRATGAGDTFLAMITLGLASGLPTPLAAELAAEAADVVVQQRLGTPCTADALTRALSQRARDEQGPDQPGGAGHSETAPGTGSADSPPDGEPDTGTAGSRRDGEPGTGADGAADPRRDGAPDGDPGPGQGGAPASRRSPGADGEPTGVSPARPPGHSQSLA